MRQLLVSMVCLGLAACASQEPLLPAPALDSGQLLSANPLDLQIPPPHDSRQWLQLDEAMLDFVEARSAGGGNAQARVQRLLAELLQDGRFHYEAGANHSASETFARQQGNCLSFSAMMVSLLRESGFRASFQRAEVEPDWEFLGDTSISSLHINTLVELPGARSLVVDWGRSAMRWRTETITDREALAEYHNNLGVRALMEKDMARAFAELRHALQMAPEIAHIWVNLAVWYRRQGDLEAAEAAWLQALIRNPQELAALGGLQRLYSDQGERELAHAIAVRLAQLRDRDPYYHYMLARSALKQGDLPAARERLQRAMALRRDPRFRELLGKLESAQLSYRAEQSRAQVADTAGP